MLPIDSGWGHKAGILGGKTKECCSDNEVHEGLKGQAPHPSDSSTVIVMWRLRGRDEFTEIRLLFSFPILEAQRAQNKKRPKPVHGRGGVPCVLPGWSSWGTPPTSSPWWGATPEPHLWSSRPLSSRTLWWSPGDAAPACFCSSSFPAKRHSKNRERKLWRVTSTKDKEDLDKSNQTASAEQASYHCLKTLANFVYSPSAPNFSPRSLIIFSVKCVIRKAFRGIYAVAMITWTQTIGSKS